MTKITLQAAKAAGYDSIVEYQFHQRHPELKRVETYSDTYDFTFMDEDGTKFQARPDFYDPMSDCYIELKAHQLNNQITKSKANSQLAKVERYKGKSVSLDRLKFGWNHSVYKQATVQNSLSSFDIDMLVVFTDDTNLSTQAQNRMDKLNLDWCYEGEL